MRALMLAAALAGCAPPPAPRTAGLVVDFDRVIAADGTVILCEVRGEPVQVAWSASLPRLAWSSPGLIQLRPDLARHVPALQKFAILHELAHLHAPMTEAAADCWAAGRAEELRVMRAGDWEDLRKELAPEGPARWRGIVACRGAE